MTTATIFPTSVFQSVFGVESSYGAGSGTPIGVLGVGMSIDSIKQDMQLNPLYKLGSRTVQRFYSQGWVVDLDTTFVLAADQKLWLNLLLNKFGSTTTYYTVSTTYSTDLIPSGYCIIEDQLGHFYNANGLMLDSVNFSFSQGKTCDVKGTFKGQLVNYSTTSSTFPSPVVYPEEFNTWATVDVSYNGTTDTFGVQPVTDLTIDIKNNMQPFYGLGSIDYKAFTATKLEVSGSVDILHDSGYLEKFLEPASVITESTTYNLTLQIGSEYGTPYTITIEGMQFNTGDMELKPVDPVVDKLTFVGRNIKIQ